MPVTQKDIARELNISHSLVGKVLNGRGNVWASSELCERIRTAAREKGYRPNAAAQALVNGRANLVAIWSAFLDLPLYTRYIAHLQMLASDAGSQALISRDPGEWKWPADGIICIDDPQRIRDYRSAGPGASIPIVGLGVLESDDVDQVVLDLESGTVEALHDLVRRGCRRIAYLLPRQALNQTEDGRWRAYHRILAEQGISPEIVVTDDMSSAAAHAALHSYAAQCKLPDGLLVFGSFMVMGVVKALSDLGATIPGDVALVTVDDSPDLPYFNPPLSAVEVPIELATAEAWRLLRYRQVHPDEPWQRTVLPTRLIRRESTG